MHSLELVTVEQTVLTFESLTAVKVFFYPILPNLTKEYCFLEG